MLYLHDVLGAARWNTAASFPKWHFAKTNFLASAISDHAARWRNTAGDRDCGARRCFDITKDSRNFCEIQSTTVKRLQKPSASKPWKRAVVHSLSSYSTRELFICEKLRISSNSLFAETRYHVPNDNGDVKKHHLILFISWEVYLSEI